MVAWSALSGASPRIAPMVGLTCGIATPGPSFKRWITTGALESGAELVAWCEEIDMWYHLQPKFCDKPGRSVLVALIQSSFPSVPAEFREAIGSGQVRESIRAGTRSRQDQR